MTFPAAPSTLYVRFEQGRGQTGVPKAHVAIWGSMTIEAAVRVSVATFRAQCCEPHLGGANGGHGVDLMPGDDWTEYELHGLDGGRLTTVPTTNTEVVLTWRNPAELTARLLKRSRKAAT